MTAPGRRAIVVGCGPERAGGGDHVGPRRMGRHGVRRPGTSRRRACAPRSSRCRVCSTTCARRSTRWRSARRRSASSPRGRRSPTTASSGSIPRCRSPIRSTAAAPPSCTARSTRPRPGSARRRIGLPAPVRPARRGRVRPHRRAALAVHDPAEAPADARPATASSGCCRRTRSHDVGSTPTRRRRCSPASSGHSILSLEGADHRRLRTDARRARPPRRMADGAGRLAADRRCARRGARGRRRHGSSATDRSTRSPSCRPPTRSLLDVTPRQLVAIAGDALPSRYAKTLAEVPVRARRVQGRLGARRPDPVDQRRLRPRRRPSTSAARSTRSPPPRPTSQRGRHARAARTCCSPSRACSIRSRAPAGTHTAWAYCHVPNGSTVDMTDRIEAQVERFAPGFRDRIIGRHTMDTAAMEAPRRQLHRRRHQRWHRRPAPVRRPPDARPAPVADAARRRLPLLQLHAARRRRARHVRLARRPRGAAHGPVMDVSRHGGDGTTTRRARWHAVRATRSVRNCRTRRNGVRRNQ